MDDQGLQMGGRRRRPRRERRASRRKGPHRAQRRRRRRCCCGSTAALPRADKGGASESPNDASESVKCILSPGEAMNGSASGSRELARSTKEACVAACQRWKLGESRSAGAPSRLLCLDLVRPRAVGAGAKLHGDVVGTARKAAAIATVDAGPEWPPAGRGERSLGAQLRKSKLFYYLNKYALRFVQVLEKGPPEQNSILITLQVLE